MCLAVPGYVEEILPDQKALIRIEDINIGQTPPHLRSRSSTLSTEKTSCTRLQISTALLPEAPQVGDYVIAHAGFAIKRMDLAEAEETLALLREMAAAVQS
jgi:hydrogenase assembly chaperone HypC/HupF